MSFSFVSPLRHTAQLCESFIHSKIQGQQNRCPQKLITGSVAVCKQILHSNKEFSELEEFF